MSQEISRRSFVAALTAGAASAAQASARIPLTEAQLVYTTKDWHLREFQRLTRDPAPVKQLFDITRATDGNSLNSIKNSMNGLIFGFGIPRERIRMVAAQHGPANLLNFDDFVWNKYEIGAWLGVDDPSTKKPAVRNPYCCERGAGAHAGTEDRTAAEAGFFAQTSIQALQQRGVTFLCCHTALEDQVNRLIGLRHLHEPREQVVHEMLGHLLPGILVVPSMAAAIALLQTEGHYSYITT